MLIYLRNFLKLNKFPYKCISNHYKFIHMLWYNVMLSENMFMYFYHKWVFCVRSSIYQNLLSRNQNCVIGNQHFEVLFEYWASLNTEKYIKGRLVVSCQCIQIKFTSHLLICSWQLLRQKFYIINSWMLIV